MDYCVILIVVSFSARIKWGDGGRVCVGVDAIKGGNQVVLLP